MYQYVYRSVAACNIFVSVLMLQQYFASAEYFPFTHSTKSEAAQLLIALLTFRAPPVPKFVDLKWCSEHLILRPTHCGKCANNQNQKILLKKKTAWKKTTLNICDPLFGVCLQTILTHYTIFHQEKSTPKCS